MLKHTTPYEMWFERKPNIKNFVYLEVLRMLTQKRTKLDEHCENIIIVELLEETLKVVRLHLVV